MSPSDIQIKKAYESESMTPSEIADFLGGMNVVAVKAKLMSISSKYRKDCGMETDEQASAEDSLNFTNEDLKQVNQVLLDTALHAEDPNLRFKAAMYVRDDKKGRKEVVKAVAGNTFNILQLNQQIAEARESAQKQIGKVTRMLTHPGVA